jgi:lysosomal alpha-glucosidase
LTPPDICGFLDNTNEELCARWIELGAFYPFSRDHNTIGAAPQELYVFPSAAASARVVLPIRYNLLPYFYSLFFRAHLNGATVVRPLFFEFPHDSVAAKIDTQFLLGPNLLISPTLAQGASRLSAYLPTDAIWYDYFSRAHVASGSQSFDVSGSVKLKLHIRGGAVLPTQDYVPPETISQMRSRPHGLIVALDAGGNAGGEMFLDDGDSLGTAATKSFLQLSFALSNHKLKSSVVVNGFSGAAGMTVGHVTFLGVAASPKQVLVDGAAASWSYDPASQVLSVTALTVPVNAPFEVSF